MGEAEQILHISRQDFTKDGDGAITFQGFVCHVDFFAKIYGKFSMAMNLQSSGMYRVSLIYSPYLSYSFFLSLCPCSEDSTYLISLSPCYSSLLPSHCFSWLISYLVEVCNISVSTEELHKD